MKKLIQIASVLAIGSTATVSYGADKYLQSLEDRIAALEAEVNATQTDVKGKGEVSSPKIPVYVTPKSKYVEEIKLRGRLQWQFGYAWGHGRTGGSHSSYSTNEIRRARIGVEGKLANDFSFLVEFNAGGGTAVGLNEAYLKYTGLDYFQPAVGRVKPRFGYEETTSSAKILTVERSRFTNLFATSYIDGATIEGEYEFFNYSLGIFNATNGGSGGTDVNPVGFGNQDYLYNASVGLNFTEMVGMPLELRADYMTFTTNPAVISPNGLNLQQNFDVSLRTGYGPFDLRAEWYYGFNSNAQVPGTAKSPGKNNEYMWAFLVEPSVFIVPDKVQLVARYEYGSSGFLIIRTTTRYENRLTGAGTPGSEYWALYGGVNYYINGDDLKLMAGYYYSEQNDGIADGLGDRSASTLYTAVRMQF